MALFVFFRFPALFSFSVTMAMQKKNALVIEQILGRYLYPYEITHHKNNIVDDDRPENIEVTTQSKHTSLQPRSAVPGNRHQLPG